MKLLVLDKSNQPSSYSNDIYQRSMQLLGYHLREVALLLQSHYVPRPLPAPPLAMPLPPLAPLVAPPRVGIPRPPPARGIPPLPLGAPAVFDAGAGVWGVWNLDEILLLGGFSTKDVSVVRKVASISSSL